MEQFTLLAAQTASGNSNSIQCTANRPEIHVTAPGMADGEGSCVIQYTNDGGSNWYDYYVDGVKQTISMDTGAITSGRVIASYGTYRVTKPATAAAVAVYATAAK